MERPLCRHVLGYMESEVLQLSILRSNLNKYIHWPKILLYIFVRETVQVNFVHSTKFN